MDTDHRLAQVAKRVEAVVAKPKAELVLALGTETAMAFVAGGIIWALALLAGVNFRVYFELDHILPPQGQRHDACQNATIRGVEFTQLTLAPQAAMSDLTQTHCENSPWSGTGLSAVTGQMFDAKHRMGEKQ